MMKISEDRKKTYLKVGGESDQLMHGKDGFYVPIERVRQRLTMCKELPHHRVLVAISNGEIIARAELEAFQNSRMQHLIEDAKEMQLRSVLIKIFGTLII